MPPDPVLEHADCARMKHPPFVLDQSQLLEIGMMIGDALVSRFDQKIVAMTVRAWHVHVVVIASEHAVADIVKCLKDSVRYGLRPGRPIWTGGYDKRYCFDEASVLQRIRYVERHNEAMGWSGVPNVWKQFITCAIV